jgi:hypothetical protein
VAEISAANHKRGRKKLYGAGKMRGRTFGRFIKKGAELFLVWFCTKTVRVVDPDPEPDPDWIRIQQLCGSGSVLGIRIPDPDPGAIKLSNIIVKMHFLVIFKKFVTTIKVSTKYVLKFFLMNYTGIFNLI